MMHTKPKLGRYLTLPEAWETLARYYESRRIHRFGLCYETSSMYELDLIDPDVYEVVLDALHDKMRPIWPRMFLWPFTVKGTKARAAFCRRQARLTR